MKVIAIYDRYGMKLDNREVRKVNHDLQVNRNMEIYKERAKRS